MAICAERSERQGDHGRHIFEWRRIAWTVVRVARFTVHDKAGYCFDGTEPGDLPD